MARGKEASLKDKNKECVKRVLAIGCVSGGQLVKCIRSMYVVMYQDEDFTTSFAETVIIEMISQVGESRHTGVRRVEV